MGARKLLYNFVQVLPNNNFPAYPVHTGLPNRYETGNEYRCGFQGQELDNEIKGEGNSINYKYGMHNLFREYGNPRVGRFFAVEPLTAEYPWNGPYAFSENRVVDGVELEGLEKVTFNRGFGNYKESVTVDFTNISDDEIKQKLTELEKYHQGHITLESIKSAKDDSYWVVTDGTILGGRSASTIIEGYNNIEEYKKGIKPIFYEVKRYIFQLLYSKDLELDNEWVEGETVLTTILRQSFGDYSADFIKGVKFSFSMRGTGKAIVNVTVTSATGKMVMGFYDFTNDIFTIEQTIENVNEKIKQENNN